MTLTCPQKSNLWYNKRSCVNGFEWDFPPDPFMGWRFSFSGELPIRLWRTNGQMKMGDA